MEKQLRLQILFPKYGYSMMLRPMKRLFVDVNATPWARRSSWAMCLCWPMLMRQPGLRLRRPADGQCNAAPYRRQDPGTSRSRPPRASGRPAGDRRRLLRSTFRLWGIPGLTHALCHFVPVLRVRHHPTQRLRYAGWLVGWRAGANPPHAHRTESQITC